MTTAGDPGADARRLLVIEDDRELADLLRRLLVGEGYSPDLAHDGQRGLNLLLAGRYDLAIIDRGLPLRDGVEILRAARASGVSTSVLMLSARGVSADRVEGLYAGADDYLVKPFDVNELIARLRALGRRKTTKADVIVIGSRTLHVESRLVRDPSGHAPVVRLSDRETELLAALGRNPAKVLSREHLLAAVFHDAESDAVVDTYVHYCRRKLGEQVIRTVRGIGYRIGEIPEQLPS